MDNRQNSKFRSSVSGKYFPIRFLRLFLGCYILNKNYNKCIESKYARTLSFRVGNFLGNIMQINCKIMHQKVQTHVEFLMKCLLRIQF